MRQGDGVVRTSGNDSLETMFAREVQRVFRTVSFHIDNEQDEIVILNIVPVIGRHHRLWLRERLLRSSG